MGDYIVFTLIASVIVAFIAWVAEENKRCPRCKNLSVHRKRWNDGTIVDECQACKYHEIKRYG